MAGVGIRVLTPMARSLDRWQQIFVRGHIDTAMRHSRTFIAALECGVLLNALRSSVVWHKRRRVAKFPGSARS